MHAAHNLLCIGPAHASMLIALDLGPFPAHSVSAGRTASGLVVVSSPLYELRPLTISSCARCCTELRIRSRSLTSQQALVHGARLMRL